MRVVNFIWWQFNQKWLQYKKEQKSLPMPRICKPCITHRFYLSLKYYEICVCQDYLKWLLVGSLTSSGNYFMHIHDDNKYNNIYRLYRNEGGMGHCVNDFWKSMMSWKRTDNISFCRNKCSSSFPKSVGTAEHPKNVTNNSPLTVYFRIKTTNRPDIIYQSTVSMHH